MGCLCQYQGMKKKSLSSTKRIDLFAGKWVVIDPIKEQIIAASATLKEISHLVKRKITDKSVPGTVPYTFKVPRKDEGPYVL